MVPVQSSTSASTNFSIGEAWFVGKRKKIMDLVSWMTSEGLSDGKSWALIQPFWPILNSLKLVLFAPIIKETRSTTILKHSKGIIHSFVWLSATGMHAQISYSTIKLSQACLSCARPMTVFHSAASADHRTKKTYSTTEGYLLHDHYMTLNISDLHM